MDPIVNVPLAIDQAHTAPQRAMDCGAKVVDLFRKTYCCWYAGMMHTCLPVAL